MSESNYVKRVAIVGVNGSVGKHIVKELLAGGKHEITALTRNNPNSNSNSNNSIPPGVKAIEINYSDPTTLRSALANQDVLIITLSTRAAPGTQDKLLEAAAAAGVRYVLPNEWGIETAHGTLGDDTMGLVGGDARGPRARVESLAAEQEKEQQQENGKGKIAWIGTTTGYWFAHSLATPEAFGFDLKNRRVTFFDEGRVKINMITWQKTGEAIAKLLTLPITPSTPSQPSLSTYANKSIFVSSWRLSQQDIFSHVQRISGTTESDWTITHEPTLQRYEGAKQRLLAGDYTAFPRALYTRTFYDNGDGDYESRHGLDNEMLGLAPETGESLDGEVRRAFELADEGYKY